MGSFVGSDVDGANATSLTGITWPAVQAGDTALLVWSMSTGSAPPNPAPSGFTSLDSYTANSGSHQIEIYWKVCTGSESGTITLTITGTASRNAAALTIYRGYDQSNPIDGFARFDETVAGTTHDAPSYTVANANTSIVTAVAERGTTGTNDYTPPTGFDQNHADTTTLAVGTGGTIVAVASEDLTTTRSASSAANPGVWTSANGFSTANAVVWTIGLKPDASLSGTVSHSTTATISPAGAGQGTSSLAASADITATGMIVQGLDENRHVPEPAPMFIAPNYAATQLLGEPAAFDGEGTVALSIAAGTTVAGRVTGTVSRSFTATITANGVVGTSSTGFLPVTVTITATGFSDAEDVTVGPTRISTGSESVRVSVGTEKQRISTGHQSVRISTGG